MTLVEILVLADRIIRVSTITAEATVLKTFHEDLGMNLSTLDSEIAYCLATAPKENNCACQ